MIFLSILTTKGISAEIEEFGKEFIDKTLGQEPTNIGVILSSAVEIPEEVNAVYASFVSSFQDTTYAFTKVDASHDHVQRFIDYVGCCREKAGIVIIDGRKKFLLSEITAEGLKTFLSDHKEGRLTRYLKTQEDDSQPDGESVRRLIGKNFKTEVLESEKEVLLMVYAPWCGHCKTLKPEYEKAAQMISKNPNVVIAKMDYTVNEVEQIQIEGFPTLFWYKKGVEAKKEPADYNGGRTASEIVQWIKDNTGFEWVQPQNTSAEEPTVQDL